MKTFTLNLESSTDAMKNLDTNDDIKQITSIEKLIELKASNQTKSNIQFVK
jgi:hypothetical protein